MKRSLTSAHTWFIALAVVAGLVTIVCFPRLGDLPRLRALSALDDLEGQLDHGGLRRALASEAESRAAIGLSDVIQRVGLRRVRMDRRSERPEGLFVARAPRLATLGAIAKATSDGHGVQVSGPDLDALAASIRWRLHRDGAFSSPRLVSVKLSGAPISRRAADQEALVEPARVEAKQTKARYREALDRYKRADARRTKLLTTRASSRRQRAASKDRYAAYLTLQQALEPMKQARTRHAHLARAAADLAPQQGSGSDEAVLVRTAWFHANGDPFEYVIPLRRARTRLAVSPQPMPPALAQLMANPLWSKIEGETLSGARSLMRGQLSWHMATLPIAGVRVTGLDMVLLLSVLLCLVLFRTIERAWAAARDYNPFEHPGRDLPRVGTGDLRVDLALLSAPACLATWVACLSIWRAGQSPWLSFGLAVASWAGVVLLGQRWLIMQEVRASVMRSGLPAMRRAPEGRRKRSIPAPPPPSRDSVPAGCRQLAYSGS